MKKQKTLNLKWCDPGVDASGLMSQSPKHPGGASVQAELHGLSTGGGRYWWRLCAGHG